MVEIARKINWLMSAQFGFDARVFVRSILGIPRYIRDLYRFRKIYSAPLKLVPCLHDWHEEGGTAGGEYFFQDLFVAQQIFKAAPHKHVDIGSRIDGFAAHVASFREIEVFDIRPVRSTVAGIVFRQADLMNDESIPENYCDSLSCLHALEHFGLGRYGDPLDPQGHLRGLRNMVRLLKPGGLFYLSSPIGEERVEFNAQRVLNPYDLVQFAEQNGLVLKGFASVQLRGTLQQSTDPLADIRALQHARYALGIFTFEKQ